MFRLYEDKHGDKNVYVVIKVNKVKSLAVVIISGAHLAIKHSKQGFSHRNSMYLYRKRDYSL